MKKIVIALALAGAAAPSVKATTTLAAGDYSLVDSGVIVSVTVQSPSGKYTGKKTEMATGNVTALTGTLAGDAVVVTPAKGNDAAKTVKIAADNKAVELTVPSNATAYVLRATGDANATGAAFDEIPAFAAKVKAITDLTTASTAAETAVSDAQEALDTAQGLVDNSTEANAVVKAYNAVYTAAKSAASDKSYAVDGAKTTLTLKTTALADAKAALAALRKGKDTTNEALGAAQDDVISAQADVTIATRALATAKAELVAANTKESVAKADVTRSIKSNFSKEDLATFNSIPSLTAKVKAKTAASTAVSKQLEAAQTDRTAWITANSTAYISVVPVSNKIALTGFLKDGTGFSYSGPTVLTEDGSFLVASAKAGSTTVVAVNHAVALDTVEGISLNFPKTGGTTTVDSESLIGTVIGAPTFATHPQFVNDDTTYTLTVKDGKFSIAASNDATIVPSFKLKNGLVTGTIKSSEQKGLIKVFGLAGVFGEDKAESFYSIFDFVQPE